MRKKIMGVTVGTPTSPNKIKDEIKPVQTVNGVKPDENGNVEISVSGGGGGGIDQETDPTVPAWAKQPNKPTYTADDVGARPNTWTPTPADIGLKTEQWELTYEDGTTETKVVYVG